MGTLVVLVLLGVGVAVLNPLSARLSVPAPVAITLFGGVLSLIPGLPTLRIEPDLVLPVILPPLLYAAARRATTKQFRDNAFPLLYLAVGLVVVTTLAVAWAATSVDPAMPFAVAVALGALVSPPDPVAATSLAAKLHLPRRLVAMLEGEGLLNDATALVIYGVAVDVATGNAVDIGDLSWRLVLALVVAPLYGLLVGWVARTLIRRLDDPMSEVAITVLAPYVAFLPMDLVGGSAVLAVVVCGLFVSQKGAGALSSGGFLTGVAVWALVDWLISGLAFGLIGYELSEVFGHTTLGPTGLTTAAVVCVVVVAVRALSIIPWGLVGSIRAGHRRWRESTVVAWAGMRGVVTVATALALPDDLPHRETVVVAAVSVVMVTLLGQGATLPFVVRKLGVRATKEEDEATELRGRALAAGLARLDGLVAEDEVSPEAAAQLRKRYEAVITSTTDPDSVSTQVRRRRRDVQQASALMRDAERDLVVSLRRSGEASPEAVARVLTEIESRELLMPPP